MAKTYTYSSKGNKVPVTPATGTVNIGVKLDNGYVYVRPNIRADEGLSGKRITTTNAAWAKRNQRTASLGMGAVGQQKRHLG